jgi:TolA-binding protein
MNAPHHQKSTKQLVKEDEFAIFLAKAEDWAENNWKTLAYAAAGVVAIGLIIWMMALSRANAERDAGYELAEARSFLNKGDYSQTADKLNALIKRHSGTQTAEEAQMTLARVRFIEGKYGESEKLFREILKDHKKGFRGAAAATGIAVCLEAKGDLTGAYEYFRKVYEMDKDAVNAPQALFDAARVSMQQNDVAKVRENALELVHRYPQSPLRTQAEELLGRVGRG